MNYQNKSQESYNTFDPLHSVSEIKTFQGKTSENGDSLLELLRDEQENGRQDQQKNTGFLRSLLHLDLGFKSWILNFQIPFPLDKNYLGNMEKDSVILVQKFKEIIQNAKGNDSISEENLDDFCKEFVRKKGYSFIEETTLNLQKILVTFLKMIVLGLSIGKKEEAQLFEKQLFGKAKNEYVQEISNKKIVKEEAGELEPINLCKSKGNFEASLHYAFDMNKKFFMSSDGERLEEFTQIIWITEAPNVLIFVFTDEEESQDNFEEDELFELPMEIKLDAFLEKNIYQVKQHQKKEAENVKNQQELESNEELENLWVKLSDCEKIIEGMSNKTESDQELLEAIKRYKSSDKGQEIAALQIRRNFPLMLNQRRLPEEECKEIYLLKEILVSEGKKGKISCRQVKDEIFQSQAIRSPICAFYMKEDRNNSQQSEMRAIKEVKELKVDEVEGRDNSVTLNVPNKVKKTADFLASSFHFPPPSIQLSEELEEKMRAAFQKK